MNWRSTGNSSPSTQVSVSIHRLPIPATRPANRYLPPSTVLTKHQVTCINEAAASYVTTILNCPPTCFIRPSAKHFSADTQKTPRQVPSPHGATEQLPVQRFVHTMAVQKRNFVTSKNSIMNLTYFFFVAVLLREVSLYLI